jgi:hypothetical protein
MITSKYKKRLRKFFFTSVNTDLSKWRIDGNDFESPKYNDLNFCTDIYPLYSYLKIIINNEYITICMYRFLIPIDFKVWLYVRKIKKRFKNEEKYNKNLHTINQLKSALQNVEGVFIKEERKEKLNKLKKI